MQCARDAAQIAIAVGFFSPPAIVRPNYPATRSP